MSVAAGVDASDSAVAAGSRRDAQWHVALVGDVSGLRALRLETELLTLAANVDRLVVNLARVTHLSFDALRGLVRARALIESRHGRLDVQALSPAAARALARAGVVLGSGGDLARRRPAGGIGANGHQTVAGRS
jgi:anti-anti-sigma regulatory factor